MAHKLPFPTPNPDSKAPIFSPPTKATTPARPPLTSYHTFPAPNSNPPSVSPRNGLQATRVMSSSFLDIPTHVSGSSFGRNSTTPNQPIARSLNSSFEDLHSPSSFHEDMPYARHRAFTESRPYSPRPSRSSLSSSTSSNQELPTLRSEISQPIENLLADMSLDSPKLKNFMSDMGIKHGFELEFLEHNASETAQLTSILREKYPKFQALVTRIRSSEIFVPVLLNSEQVDMYRVSQLDTLTLKQIIDNLHEKGFAFEFDQAIVVEAEGSKTLSIHQLSTTKLFTSAFQIKLEGNRETVALMQCGAKSLETLLPHKIRILAHHTLCDCLVFQKPLKIGSQFKKLLDEFGSRVTKLPAMISVFLISDKILKRLPSLGISGSNFSWKATGWVLQVQVSVDIASVWLFNGFYRLSSEDCLDVALPERVLFAGAIGSSPEVSPALLSTLLARKAGAPVLSRLIENAMRIHVVIASPATVKCLLPGTVHYPEGTLVISNDFDQLQRQLQQVTSVSACSRKSPPPKSRTNLQPDLQNQKPQ